MPRVRVGEVCIHYVEQGEGDVILFVPGLVGISKMWEFQFPHFAKNYRCLSFDHRGSGESDRPEGGYSTEVIARDAVGLLDALGIERAHVVGASTGGCILQNLALDSADRVRCCVFTNTWTTADPYFTRLQTARRRILLAYGKDAYVEVSTLWTGGWASLRHTLEKQLELERRQRETLASIEILTARIDMTLTHDRHSEIGRIRKPALIVAARDDALTPPYFAEELNGMLPGSKLVVLEEGGHNSYRKNHAAWNRAVAAFLAERGADA